MSGAWFAGVPHWTPEEIVADVAAARNEFRARRLGEPVDRYLAAFDASLPHASALIAQLRLALVGGAQSGELLKDLWATQAGRTAFRYLGAPPISQDDLETLAEAKFSPASAGDEDGRLERLLAVMRAIIDPRRFPWIVEGREPTAEETAAAVLASTALAASQRVQVMRRSDEKAMVEGSVKDLLIGAGWVQAARPPGGIRNILNDSPAPRSFVT